MQKIIIRKTFFLPVHVKNSSSNDFTPLIKKIMIKLKKKNLFFMLHHTYNFLI